MSHGVWVVEALEARRHLAASGPDGAFEFAVAMWRHTLTPEQLAANHMVSVEWQGVPGYAAAGEWIVGLHHDGPTEWAGPSVAGDAEILTALERDGSGIQFDHYLGAKDVFTVRAPVEATYQQVFDAVSTIDGFSSVGPDMYILRDPSDCAGLLPSSYRPAVESVSVDPADGKLHVGTANTITARVGGMSEPDYPLPLFLEFWPEPAATGVGRTPVVLGSANPLPEAGTDGASVTFANFVMPPGPGHLEIDAAFGLMEAYRVGADVIAPPPGPAIGVGVEGPAVARPPADAGASREEAGRPAEPAVDPAPMPAVSAQAAVVASEPAVGVAAPAPVSPVVQSVAAGAKGSVTVALKNPMVKRPKAKQVVTFYLSADSRLNRADTLFSRQVIGGVITAGQSGSRVLTYQLPRTARLGTRYVIAVTDTGEVTATKIKVIAPRRAVAARVRRGRFR